MNLKIEATIGLLGVNKIESTSGDSTSTGQPDLRKEIGKWAYKGQMV